MEFFEYADIATSPEEIRAKLTIDSLPVYCQEIEAVDAAEELGRVIYFSHWGRFHICCCEVMGGVRFWVPDCPNALAWTVTTGYPPAPDKIVLHATINRTEHSADFIDATRRLIATLKAGLEEHFVSDRAPAPAPKPTHIPCL
ncbi:MAG: hypothetical protein C0613_06345 [Desulfobulbaceae bacterium]|nr:MAG: hypothetical protein C0613_06345 [Desulfobulbaceae bacterium]